MDRHAHLTKSQTAAIKAEVAFTKMVILITGTASVTQLIDLVITVFNRVRILQLLDIFDPRALEVIMLVKSMSHFWLYSAYALDACVFLE